MGAVTLSGALVRRQPWRRGAGRGEIAPAMSAREPVQRRHLIPGSTPAEVYAVVTDFDVYPRLFPEIKSARVLETSGPRVRVEFRAQIVLPIRYVLDLVCDAQTFTVDWTFVEGEIVTDSVGGWRLSGEGDGTAIDYRISIELKAPVPGFVLRKVTDGLVAASLPNMFAAIDREVRRRQGLLTSGLPAT
jgi:ribosome-associated toxin RatA of RatAB toxin-antitoxin module